MLTTQHPAATAEEEILIPLYQDDHERLYYVNPFRDGAPAWMDDVETDLFPFVSDPERQLTFVLIEDSVPIVSAKVAAGAGPLQNFYVTVTTGSSTEYKLGKGEFVVPLAGDIPVGARIVNFRLHTAVVAKSQYVLDSHNNEVWVAFGAGASSAAPTRVVLSPSGNYSAQGLLALLQTALRALQPSFTCALDVTTARAAYTCDVPFCFSVPVEPRVPVCREPLGLRCTDKKNAHFLPPSEAPGVVSACRFASLPSGASHRVVSGHLDVSGTRMLRLALRRYGGGGLEVGHVPMQTGAPCGGGVVLYESLHTGTRERAWRTPLEYSPVVVCGATDSFGRPYDFHGVPSTYVFEVTAERTNAS